MLTEQLHQRWQALSVPVVADALTELGLKLAFLPGFRPFLEGSMLVGSAVTLRIARTDQERRGVYSHLEAALESARAAFAPVLVVQSSGIEEASWDSVLTLAAKQRGVRGIVLDGAARDVAELGALGVPLFATALSPWPVSNRVDTVSTGEPVHIGGGEVIPGDLILADANGIAVVPADSVRRVLERAEQRKAELDAVRQKLLGGAAYRDAVG